MRKRNKLLSAVLGAVLLTGNIGMCANAANVVEIPATEVASVYNLAVDSNEIEGWA